jgi:hypothetical protein
MIENNIIHSVRFSGESSVEPVSVEEVKKHLPLEGITHYDGTLDLLIQASRASCERYTGLSFIDRTVTITATVYGHYTLHLPYGPVKEITLVKMDGVEITDGFSLTLGDNFSYDVNGQYEITYTISPAFFTRDVQNAIKAYATYLFEHRGEEKGIGDCELAYTLLNPYKTVLL